MIKPRFLGFTPDGRWRYAADYDLPPIMGGSGDPSSDDQVDASTDDAWEHGSYFHTTPTYISVRSSEASALRDWAGLRFHNGSFPAQGSTIDVAYIQIYIYSSSYDDPNLDIYAEDGASPPTFTTAPYNISSRTRTTASAAWVTNNLLTGWKQSPSIVNVIQELATDYTPTAIVLILKPREDTDKYLRFQAWDEISHVLGAKLHLEWTEGGVQTLTPDPVAAPFVTPDPTISTGAITVAASPVAISTQVPTVALSKTVTVAPDPVTLPLAVVDPTLSTGSVALAPSPVTIPLVIVAPILVAGGLLSPAPVAISLVVVDPTIVASIALAPSPVVLPFAVPDSQVMATITLSPASITLPFAVPEPSMAIGVSTILPTPAVTIWAIPSHVLIAAGAEGFTQFGNIIRLIAGSDFPSTALFYFEVTIRTQDPAKTAKARLYNITDGAVVAGSEVTTTSTTVVRLRSSALSLPSGAKEYRAEFGGDGSGIYTCYGADVKVDSG